MSKTSDNVNLDFPSRMADGRIFTDYRPNCVMNSALAQGKDSFEYRYYLTNSGNAIEKQKLDELQRELECPNEFIFDFIKDIQQDWDPDSCKSKTEKLLKNQYEIKNLNYKG